MGTEGRVNRATKASTGVTNFVNQRTKSHQVLPYYKKVLIAATTMNLEYEPYCRVHEPKPSPSSHLPH